MLPACPPAALHRPGHAVPVGGRATRSTATCAASPTSSPRRGHRVLIVAPSRSQELVRESRRAVRAGELTLAGTARPRCSPSARRCRRCPAAAARAAADRRRAHDRGAVRRASRSTSATSTSRSRRASSSVALRHSRALNVGTLPRADRARRRPRRSRARSSSSSSAASTRASRLRARRATLLQRFFPGEYEVVAPGADAVERAAGATAAGRDRVRRRTRSAARCACSCARCGAWTAAPWEVVVHRARGPSSSTPLRAELRGACASSTASDEAPLARADVARRRLRRRRPGARAARARAGGRRRAARGRLPVYEEVAGDGEAACCSRPATPRPWPPSSAA